MPESVLTDYSQTVPCPSCRGAGESIPSGKQCPKCHAKKFVEEEKILEVEVERGMKNGINADHS